MVLFLVAASTFAAPASTNSIARYSVRISQSDDGLPHNSVWAVAQGAQGYLWVGTQQGLVRFDGLRFVTLDESAPAELKRGWITALCATLDGSLWIGCDGYGLARMKGGSFTHFGEGEGLPNLHVTALYHDRSDRVWVGTYSGLACLVNGEVVAKPMNEAGFGDLVYTIYEDREENLWVGARDGLYRLTPARFTTYTAREGLSCNNA